MTEAERNEIARQERNKYYREWRKKNPDKIRDINARYWMKRAEKLEGDVNRAEE